MVHRPYFQTPFGYTLVPNPRVARESVLYSALVLQVEILAGGELAQGSLRRLSDRGWGLLAKKNEVLRFLRQVVVDFGLERAQVSNGRLRFGNGAERLGSGRSAADFELIQWTRDKSVGAQSFLGEGLLQANGPMFHSKEQITGAAMQDVIFGHRIIMLELFSGRHFV